jgi:hypothetical protein
MRLEPSYTEQFYKEFTQSCAYVKAIKEAAEATPPSPGAEEVKVGLWPADMMDWASSK